MARSYPEAQTASPTTVEVVWQRRPRARQIPVQFLPAPLPSPAQSRASAPELAWRPRPEGLAKPEQS